MNHSFHLGDMRQLCQRYPDNHFTAVVTDPPHNLGDLEGSEAWDTDVAEQAMSWRHVLRVMRPGAHLLCITAPQTHHRIATAVEQGGFEIIDCLLWLHSEGMPKTRNVLKEIDCQYGNALDLTEKMGAWQGWGTALRPCWTPILVARKRMPSTFAVNAYQYGVAGMAIDRARIKTRIAKAKGRRGTKRLFTAYKSADTDHTKGRHPTNVLLDTGTATMLDTATSTSKREQGRKQYARPSYPHYFRNLFFKGKHPRFGIADGNSGGPVSRFFYCARATALDRCEYNDHPCVKPAALMQYLAALVTYPDDNLILDPFSGSGSTAVACRILEYQGIRVSTVNFDLVPRYLGIGYRRVRDAQPPRRKRC